MARAVDDEMTRSRGTFVALQCSIPGVRAVQAQSAHGFPPHMHDDYGVGRIRSGAQKSRSGRGMVEASAGDVITCNPDEVHDGRPIGDSRAWTMLYFDRSLITAAFADVREQTAHFEFERPRLRDRRAAIRFERLFDRLTAPDADDLRSAEELLLQLIAELWRPGSDTPLRSPPQSVMKIVRRIDSDPATPAPLAELASEAGFSAYRLIRAFRGITGLTPHAYTIQRRLQLARRLLAERMPIAEAALSAGFADQSHLTRMFSRTYGVSPGDFERACR
jgi:AraC-like DNA-binding protein